jgi:hypothetical protein
MTASFQVVLAIQDTLPVCCIGLSPAEMEWTPPSLRGGGALQELRYSA